MLCFEPPGLRHIPALTEYAREVREADGDFDGTAGLGLYREPIGWLAAVGLQSRPDAARRGMIPVAVFLGLRGERIVGMGNVRLSTEPAVAEEAGHIGYHVRPSERRKGYGRELLDHGVSLCRANGILFPSLLICRDNLPSLRIAESAGFRVCAEKTLEDGTPACLLRRPPESQEQGQQLSPRFHGGESFRDPGEIRHQ